MHELCDGIIALPGGFGTLEELFEILTWAQLGLHKKPIGLLDINGFYNHLKKLLQTMVDKGFLKEINYDMLLISDDINDSTQSNETVCRAGYSQMDQRGGGLKRTFSFAKNSSAAKTTILL